MHFDQDIIREVLQACQPHQEIISERIWQQFQSKKLGQDIVSLEQQKKMTKHIFKNLNIWIDYAADPKLFKLMILHHREIYEQYGMTEVHYRGVAKTLNATMLYFFEEQWTESIDQQWKIFTNMILSILGSNEELITETRDVTNWEFLDLSDQNKATENSKQIQVDDLKPLILSLIQEELHKYFGMLNTKIHRPTSIDYQLQKIVNESTSTSPFVKDRLFYG